MLPSMKKTTTTFSAALLLTLASCGPTPEEAARGYYELDVEDLKTRFAESVKGKENSMSRSIMVSLERSSGFIRLQSEGQLEFNIGGPELPVTEGTWTIDGDKLKMAIAGDKQVAKLANDTITMVTGTGAAGTKNFVKKPEPAGAEPAKAEPEKKKPEKK